MMLPMQVRRRNGNLSPIDAFDREFDRMFGRWMGEPGERADVTAAYPVDIHEDDDHIYVEAEMPGFSKDDVNVTMENGVLSITAERKQEEKQGERHLTERRFTRVARSFSLPNTVDENDVQAQLKDGVLHLTLSKRQEVKPRRIEVK